LHRKAQENNEKPSIVNRTVPHKDYTVLVLLWKIQKTSCVKEYSFTSTHVNCAR